MIRKSIDAERAAAFAVADLMITAAKTAPKGCGADKIVALAVDGNEKDSLSTKMREIAAALGQDFFNRDANNVDNAHWVVLIGVKDIPLALPSCGYCGFANCGQCKNAGSHCAFNVTDLGIAVGSAVSIAADHRIDNRVMYSAGRAAIDLGYFEKDVKICYAIPLSTSSKSIFFDRDPNNVLIK
ncbi:MAG: DUF2148 domain-containing protein [Anaerovoracaceae bacterium]